MSEPIDEKYIFFVVTQPLLDDLTCTDPKDDLNFPVEDIYSVKESFIFLFFFHFF
jgi:hypothetical protein